MKTDWQIKKLGEVCDFYNGLWKGKEPPYIHVGVIRNTNITKEGRLDDAEIAFLDVEKKQFAKRKLECGDIVLEKSGGGPKQPVGRVIVFDKKDGDFSFSNFTSAIRVKDKRTLDFNFLHKFLFYSYISGITEGMQSHSTGIRNLDLHAYKEIETPIPPLSEQKRIVKKLNEVFEKVAVAKENAEKNLQNSKELFESHLQGVFAKPGKDWEEKKLGDKGLLSLIDGDRGKNYPKKSDFQADGHCLFMNTKNVRPDGFDFTTKMFVTEKKDKALGNGKLQRNDVVMTTRGTIGNLGLYDVTVEYNNIRINSGMLIFRPNTEKLSPDYLFEILRSGVIKTQIKKNVSGTAQPQLPIKTLVNFAIPVPKSLSEQKAIVKKLDALSIETKKLEKIYQQKLADLEELKKSVLSKAFAGEL